MTVMQLPLMHSLALTHVSPFLSRQAPAPLQALGATQVIAALMSSALSGRSEQVPSLPATLQDWQVPVHAVSQQTVSTQLLLLHSDAIAHAALLHFPQTAPPQSMPVSSPFIMPSLQLMQVFVAVSHRSPPAASH